MIENQSADTSTSTTKRLREIVAAQVENASLRSVAREIGMSPISLRQFLQGTEPYSRTLRRLRIWYIQHAAVQRGQVESEDASAALDVLLHDLAPGPRRKTVNRLLDSLASGYDESGKTPPSWLAEMRASFDLSPSFAAAPEARPSAFGKYRGVLGSSAEYAELKQADIDLEDRRSAWNTFSTRAR